LTHANIETTTTKKKETYWQISSLPHDPWPEQPLGQAACVTAASARHTNTLSMVIVIRVALYHGRYLFRLSGSLSGFLIVCTEIGSLIYPLRMAPNLAKMAETDPEPRGPPHVVVSGSDEPVPPSCCWAIRFDAPNPSNAVHRPAKPGFIDILGLLPIAVVKIC
jgi:hypothetical protein